MSKQVRMYKDDERGGRPHINIVKLKLLSQGYQRPGVYYLIVEWGPINNGLAYNWVYAKWLWIFSPHAYPLLFALRHKSYLQMWSQQPQPFCRTTGGHRHNILCSCVKPLCLPSHCFTTKWAFTSLKQIATLNYLQEGVILQINPFDSKVSRYRSSTCWKMIMTTYHSERSILLDFWNEFHFGTVT